MPRLGGWRPSQEGEGDLLVEAGRAMRMRVRMDLLGGMGILRRRGGGGSATLDAPEILTLKALGRRARWT
jgi:hypothetical protein